MSGRSGVARRASRGYPCPVCGRTKSCSVTEKGLVFCIGASGSGDGWRHVRTCDNGFSVFARDEGETGTPRPARRAKVERPDANQGAAPTPLLRKHLCKKQDRLYLADQLGIHVSGIDRLGAGRVPAEGKRPGHWLLPERDQFGVLVGLQTRDDAGGKRHVEGTKRGLAYAVSPRDGAPAHNVALLPEGYSNTAAAESVGLWAVGRPSNAGGAEAAAALLQHAAQRLSTPVLVVGDNDEKPGGRWPGRDGGEAVARKLASLLGVEVLLSFPPEGHKDLRDWVRGLLPKPKDSTEAERHAVGRAVLDDLLARAERIPAGEGTLPPLPDDPVEGDSPEVAEVLHAGSSLRPCPKHQTPFLRHKGNAAHHRVVQAYCKSWSCPVCNHRKRSMWMAHLLGLFGGAGSLYVSALHGRDFGGAKRKLQRAKADYAVAHKKGGGLVLIADAPCGLIGEREAKPAEAAAAAARAILDLDTNQKQPVTTSRGWAMEKPGGPGEFRRVGQGRQGEFATIVGRLRKKGLDPQMGGTPKTGNRADWHMPEGAAEEEVEHLLDQLRAPRHDTEIPDPLDDMLNLDGGDTSLDEI